MDKTVIIIGSGIGGLLVGCMLAKQGMKVTIIEKNKQIGGCLQSFGIKKELFDSCVHYIGGLEKGNSLYKILDYTEVMDSLCLLPLSVDCFDKIYLNNQVDAYYPIAQGYDNFIVQLVKKFPNAEYAIRKYIDLIKDTCTKFPLYHLQNGTGAEKLSVMNKSLLAVLNELTNDELLKQALCGNAFLYAGNAATTPFYVHALVVSSYIENAYKIKGSSAQIAKGLWKTLQRYGGVIYTNERVKKIDINKDNTFSVHTSKDNHYESQLLVSAIHPLATFKLLDAHYIKPALLKRIEGCSNSVSAFMVNAVLAKKILPYNNSNIYFNAENPLDVIGTLEDSEGLFKQFAVYFNEDNSNPGFVSSLSILTYMDFKRFSNFEHTFNTTNNPSSRCEAYQLYKQQLGNELLAVVSEKFPELIAAVEYWEAVSPLTFRDYMGTNDGSMYGMIADYQQPLASQVSVQTRIPNLYLTGQNINLHGVLGTSLSAVAAVGAIIGMEEILNAINAEY